MPDNQGWTHADVYLLAIKLVFHQLLCLLRDWLQTINEERGDTRNQLHHGSHGYTEEENLLDVELCCPTYQGTHDDTKYQWFTEHTKLLLQTLCVDVELRETRNFIEQLIEDDGERHKALAEWLRNGDTIEVVILLEFLGCQVGAYQGDDVANDGSKIAPKQTLPHYKVSHGSDKSKVPIVPKVDVDGTCGLGYQHEEVDTQADRDN